MTPHAMELFSIFLGALGTFLLVREVSKGHNFEKLSRQLVSLSREMKPVQELTDLYGVNPREFWIRSYMYLYPKLTRARVDEMAAMLSQDQIVESAAQSKALYEQQAPASLKYLEESTKIFETTFAENQLMIRKILLWTGFALLMMSAALHLLSVTSE